MGWDNEQGNGMNMTELSQTDNARIEPILSTCFFADLIWQVIVISLICIKNGGGEFLGVRAARLGCIDNVKLSTGMSSQM